MSKDNDKNLKSDLLKKTTKFVLLPSNPFASLGVISNIISKDTRYFKQIIVKLYTKEKATDEENKLLDVKDYNKRFQIALKMNGQTDDSVPKIIKNVETNFYIIFSLFVLSLIYGFMSPSFGLAPHTGFILFNLLSRFFLTLPLLAFTIKVSFQLYQLRSRALMPFSFWVKDPVAWFGAQPKHLPTILTFCLVLFSAFAGFPDVAHAQAAGGGSGSTGIDYLFTKLSANDLSLQWLQTLFPAAVNLFNGNTAGATTGSTDLFQSLFQILNSVLLAIASGSLAYQVFSGTVDTAHSGKVLGEKYHQIWAPIRVVSGFGLLFPVNGYCVAQLLAIQILLAGYGLANGVWTTYVGEVMGNTSAYNGTSGANTGTTSGSSALQWQVPLSQQQQIVDQVTSAAACAAFLSQENGGATSVDNGGQPLYVLNVPSVSPTNPSGGSWNFGSACGSFSVADTTPNPTTTNSNCTSSAVITERGVIPGISCADNQLNGFANTYQQAKITAFNNLVNSIQGNSTLINSLVSQVMANQASEVTSSTVSNFTNQYASSISSGTPTTGNVSGNVGSTYIAALASASNAFLNAANQTADTAFLSVVNQLGWAAAGSQEEMLNNYTQQAYSLVIKSLPTFTSGVATNLAPSEITGLSNMQNIISTASQSMDPNSLLANNDNQSPSSNPSTEADKAMSKIFQGGLGAALASGLANNTAMSAINPVGDIQTFGDHLLDAGYGSLVAWVAAKALAGGEQKEIVGKAIDLATGGPSAIQAALTAVGFLVKAIVGGLFVLGVVDAIIVPMTFFIIWLFAIVSTISFAIEFVVAAPFWAFSHIKMEGRELIDQNQKGGYQMLFNAAFRPTILLFSLIAASLLFSTVITYLNTTFGSAFISARGNSTIGVISLLSELTMLVYLHYQLAIKSLALITKGPELVAQFLGTQDQRAGEAQDARNVTGVVGGFVKTGASNVGGAKKVYDQSMGVQAQEQAKAISDKERLDAMKATTTARQANGSGGSEIDAGSGSDEQRGA